MGFAETKGGGGHIKRGGPPVGNQERGGGNFENLREIADCPKKIRRKKKRCRGYSVPSAMGRDA